MSVNNFIELLIIADSLLDYCSVTLQFQGCQLPKRLDACDSCRFLFETRLVNVIYRLNYFQR